MWHPPIIGTNQATFVAIYALNHRLGTAWALIAKLNVVTRRCREHFPTPPSPPRFALQKAGSLER